MDHLRAIGVIIGICIFLIGVTMRFFGTRNEIKDAPAWLAAGVGIAAGSFIPF